MTTNNAQADLFTGATPTAPGPTHYAETRAQREARLRAEFIGPRSQLRLISGYTLAGPHNPKRAPYWRARFTVIREDAGTRTVTTFEYTYSGKARKAPRWTIQRAERRYLSEYDASRQTWTRENGADETELGPQDADRLAALILAEASHHAGQPLTLSDFIMPRTVYARATD